MEMDQIIETGVAHTAAAHIVRHSTTRGREELTVVWSTRTHLCDPIDDIGQHAKVTLAADVVPVLWEHGGVGWEPPGTQCPVDGRYLAPTCEVVRGHAEPAQVEALAQLVAERADAMVAADRARIRRELRRWINLTSEVDEDLPRLDTMGEPGVGVDAGGVLVAWAYDPHGAMDDGCLVDMIEVREDD